MTAENDSADLEALFDSVLAESTSLQRAFTEPPAPPAVEPAVSARPAASVPNPGMVPVKSGNTDDAELQSLFDSVAADYLKAVVPSASGRVEVLEAAATDVAVPPVPAADQQQAAFKRVGKMARELHDTLRELGYDKMLENTMAAIPDAKDRLAYIANLTEQAACRVLNATDVAQPLISGLENSANTLADRWDRVFANQLGVGEFKQLAEETRAFLRQDVRNTASATNAQLTEIMMAQDFQDLTGQVIKKIAGLTQNLENGLMSVLVELMPSTMRSDEVNSLLNGPVINSDGRADVVVNQQQVDDLLDSLGF